MYALFSMTRDRAVRFASELEQIDRPQVAYTAQKGCHVWLVGSPAQIVQFIGVLANHGEDCLIRAQPCDPATHD